MERNTKQKRIVAQVLAEAGGPLTVAEILKAGQRIIPALGMATVYRSIKRLSAAEEIHAVEIPGDPIRYEIAHHHHHHFKCGGCDKVYELEGCLKELRTLVPRGFRMESHDLTFYGHCRGCVSQAGHRQ
jgi:Fur family ferric uptake transcriptional regulator